MDFKVRRREPELIRPAAPTPHEFKPLSDIDDQGSLRFQIPYAYFYPSIPSQRGKKDPVKVIREALAKALVFYYPLAGRLREGNNQKLTVECNGEGVVFIEADADATLDQLGGSVLCPPFACFEELLFDVPGTNDIVNCPLLLFQVTRLNCGGFIVAVRLNHTITDAFGLVQFMSTMGEIARGASLPSTLPLWERHLLGARNPPCVTCIHPEFNEVNNTNSSILPAEELVHNSFFFGPTELSRLRKLVPSSLSHVTSFELLTACIWKCRTIALQFNPSEETRIICCVNIRCNTDIALPKTYYGNSFALSAAVATAEDVARKPIGYALDLLEKAKENVTTEFIKSLADLMAIKGKPHYTLRGSYAVSDVSHIGFESVNLGWGRAVFGGPAKGGVGVVPGYITFYVSCRNKRGERGVGIPISLPKKAMERFEMELERLLGRNRSIIVEKKESKFIRSPL